MPIVHDGPAIDAAATSTFQMYVENVGYKRSRMHVHTHAHAHVYVRILNGERGEEKKLGGSVEHAADSDFLVLCCLVITVDDEPDCPEECPGHE